MWLQRQKPSTTPKMASHVHDGGGPGRQAWDQTQSGSDKPSPPKAFDCSCGGFPAQATDGTAFAPYMAHGTNPDPFQTSAKRAANPRLRAQPNYGMPMQNPWRRRHSVVLEHERPSSRGPGCTHAALPLQDVYHHAKTHRTMSHSTGRLGARTLQLHALISSGRSG
jgi:hypothetical protein